MVYVWLSSTLKEVLRMKELKWNGSTITVEPPKKPKKITGTHFPTIVGVNPFATDFEVWCRCTRTYEIPFEGNKYTNAGQVIEPKVFDFLLTVQAPGRSSASSIVIR